MCLGQAVQPSTDKARFYVSMIRVLMGLQVLVVILNFVAASYFLTQAIFGIFFFFLLYITQHQISYQVIMIYVFISIFFAVIFLTYFLLPIQQGTNLAAFSGMDKFAYAVSIISFVYYTFCTIFCFYPYKEFKAIAYNQNPALKNYFESQNQMQNPAAKDDANNVKKANYEVDYGNIQYDQKKKNNDNGTFEVFKGKGVVIG